MLDCIAGLLRIEKRMFLGAAVGAAITVFIAVAEAQNVGPQFSVVSIKPCKSGPTERVPASPSPDRLVVNCLTVKQLINLAYVRYASGRRNPPSSVPVSGGAAWTDTDQFRIEAKADEPSNQNTMRGPMLQAILEGKFKLRVHEETKQIPVYAVTVDKNGSHLDAAKEGSCEERVDYPAPQLPGQQPPPNVCGAMMRTPKGISAYHVTLADLLSRLSPYLDRPIMDKTGIVGIFDFHLDISVDELPLEPNPESADPVRDEEPSVLVIRTALRKLGLNLQGGNGPGKSIVIDAVQRPPEN